MTDKEPCERELAFQMGAKANESDFTMGGNPYNPEDQPECYEAWLDGWGSVSEKRLEELKQELK